MKLIKINMWHDKKIMLKDLLDMLMIRSDLDWYLLDFSGSGVAPGGGGMVAFEKSLRNSSSGLHFSSEGLKAFAMGLTDITDLTLSGIDHGRQVVKISGLDSTYWEVWIDDEVVRMTIDAN